MSKIDSGGLVRGFPRYQTLVTVVGPEDELWKTRPVARGFMQAFTWIRVLST